MNFEKIFQFLFKNRNLLKIVIVKNFFRVFLLLLKFIYKYLIKQLPYFQFCYKMQLKQRIF